MFNSLLLVNVIEQLYLVAATKFHIPYYDGKYLNGGFWEIGRWRPTNFLKLEQPEVDY